MAHFQGSVVASMSRGLCCGFFRGSAFFAPFAIFMKRGGVLYFAEPKRQTKSREIQPKIILSLDEICLINVLQLE
jgi:hypothetical protein